MLAAVLAVAVSAAPVDVVASPEASAPSPWGIEVRLGAPPVGFVAPLPGSPGTAGVGGLVVGLGLASILPTTSLFAARALDAHWVVELGLGGSGSCQLDCSTFSAWSGSAQALVKWFPARAFDGLWVGAGLPLSLSSSASVLTTDAGTARARQRSFSVGVDALVGWSLAFGGRFFASFALGPSVRWSEAVFTVTNDPATASSSRSPARPSWASASRSERERVLRSAAEAVEV